MGIETSGGMSASPGSFGERGSGALESSQAYSLAHAHNEPRDYDGAQAYVLPPKKVSKFELDADALDRARRAVTRAVIGLYSLEHALDEPKRVSKFELDADALDRARHAATLSLSLIRSAARSEGGVTGGGDMKWVRIGDPDVGVRAAERRRVLNTKITYVCEAASRKSGLPPWRHAGVQEGTFKEWEKDRNFFYWPPDDIAAAIDERMRLDGYTSVDHTKGTPAGGDLLTVIGEAVMEGYKLYRLAAAAHGIVHPG